MTATSRRNVLLGVLLVAGAAGTAFWWPEPESFRYLSGEPREFVARFAAPPSADSADTRRELDELLEMQRVRTPAQVEAARTDRKQDVARFYAALGLDPAHAPDLPKLRRLTHTAREDIGPYVRAVKEKYRRLRPYEIEPRLEPCIGDVKGDQSYPSGHATYGFLMGLLLADLVPERRDAIMERAADFARQRMVCGVHFRSDIDAGERGARYLFDEMRESAAYRRDALAAGEELRAALGLSRQPPRPR